MSYDMIDRFLRNNLDDDSYAEYSAALDELCAPPAQRKPLTDEPVRIYDYVWPQRDEDKEECIYACSYAPGRHLPCGELLAVVHPSQLKNAYLQREVEAVHGIKENTRTSNGNKRRIRTVWGDDARASPNGGGMA